MLMFTSCLCQKLPVKSEGCVAKKWLFWDRRGTLGILAHIYPSPIASLEPFKWCHFKPEIILLNVRWYLCYGLSYRDLEEMMLEHGLKVDSEGNTLDVMLSVKWDANAAKRFLKRFSTRPIRHSCTLKHKAFKPRGFRESRANVLGGTRPYHPDRGRPAFCRHFR